MFGLVKKTFKKILILFSFSLIFQHCEEPEDAVNTNEEVYNTTLNLASVGNGSTIGFAVPDEETGNAWHQAGLDNGGESCEGPPGIRDVKKLMGTDMYLAYLRDPSGNKICALKRMS